MRTTKGDKSCNVGSNVQIVSWGRVLKIAVLVLLSYGCVVAEMLTSGLMSFVFFFEAVSNMAWAYDVAHKDP